jgi:hypothetical protein
MCFFVGRMYWPNVTTSTPARLNACDKISSTSNRWFMHAQSTASEENHSSTSFLSCCTTAQTLQNEVLLVHTGALRKILALRSVSVRSVIILCCV